MKSELVRIDYPVIRILEIDPHTAGAHPRDRSAVSSWSVRVGARETAFPGLLAAGAVAGLVGVSGSVGFHRRGFDPAGRPIPVRGQGALAGVGARRGACRRSRRCADGPHGAPVQGAGHARRRRMHFARKKSTGSRPSRGFTGSTRSQPPAVLAFSYVDRPELVDDFLKPPADPGTKGVARFRYPDRSGKTRVFDWALSGQEGKSIALPESDLTVTLSRVGRVSHQRHRTRSISG